jgi:flagellar biosynthetic protein FliR
MIVDEPTLGAFLVALTRATALAATAPVIGDTGVPLRAKVVFVVVVAAAVSANHVGVPIADLPLAATIELAVGLITGLTARFVMSRVAVAGQLMGLSLGFGFASQYDIHAGESAITVRTLLTTFASLAFLAAGGLEAIVRGVAAPAHVFDLALLGPELVRQGTAAMGNGLALAAPMVLAALVANVGLAVMNRAAPAVNVFAISLATVLLAGGSILLGSSGSMVTGIASIAHEAVSVFVR